MGACCDEEGNCTQTLEADCPGVWYSEVACDPNPCCVVVNVDCISSISIVASASGTRTEGCFETVDLAVSKTWTREDRDLEAEDPAEPDGDHFQTTGNSCDDPQRVRLFYSDTPDLLLVSEIDGCQSMDGRLALTVASELWTLTAEVNLLVECGSEECWFAHPFTSIIAADIENICELIGIYPFTTTVDGITYSITITIA